MKSLARAAFWIVATALGALAFGGIATARGEPINAWWLIAAAVCVYAIGYRVYGAWVATRVLLVDGRPTPAVRIDDGRDFVPTNRWVVFGHHFAAIAGPGPLVGPTLAAQFGYLPGTLWILIGAVLGGCIQDMVILFCSTRRDGRSLGQMARDELGPVGGGAALVGTLMILVILISVLGLVIVNAMKHSPWATATVAATIPIAVLVGVYMRSIRPGRVLEGSAIGVALLLLAVWGGGWVDQHPLLRTWFDHGPLPIAYAIMVYGFAAAVLPVWLLLAPRDYLSTFLKIGTIVGLALGIFIVAPQLQMPAITKFIDGSGPVWSGNLFPFLFITIACGAVSGFHALISSGTTPKLLDRETDAPLIGYGGMLMESFVAIMALVAASVIDPGVYFAMNSPAALIGKTAQEAATVISQWGFVVTPEVLTQTAADVGESTIISRAGGAPTLAVGMAHILHQVIGGQGMMAFWYHFAILFEALFILTAVDAGTRAGRFMLQDLMGSFVPAFKRTEALIPNLVATGLCVAAWGYFLYQGVVDPLGGINTLWPLFGVANQMLAAVALVLATVVLVKMKKQRYMWVTVLPTVWLLACTLTAGWQKVFSENPKIGFLAHAAKFSAAAENGEVLAPAKSIEQMQQVIFNDYVDAALASMFVLVVLSITFFGIRKVLQALRHEHPTVRETHHGVHGETVKA